MGFQDDRHFRWTEERGEVRLRAWNARASVIRATVYWNDVARRRPANAANPFDPAYRLSDIDELARAAQDQDMELMLSIWGTPRWAGPKPNALPRRLSDLTTFARAISSRYSGRYPGFPHVRFWSIWNEPNLNMFLTPQFDRRGRSVGPALYARLYRAGYAGIKAGNPLALVAIGDTSARGRDKRRAGQQDTHSPGRFAELVSKTKPRVRFDAWAHHPYPTGFNIRPTQIVRWPNVTMTGLPRFGASLDKWFKRRNTPIWITEYAHETRPEDPRGVTHAQQATYLRQAVTMARRNPRVQMFIWFILRDDVPREGWQSGLVDEVGVQKPAFNFFASLAGQVDARNSLVNVKAGRANPLIRFSALRLAARAGVGAKVGITYAVYSRTGAVADAQPESRIDRDGWVGFRAAFTPQAGQTYTVFIRSGDIHGNIIERTLTLVGVR